MTTQLKSNLVLLSEQVVDYSCMLCPTVQTRCHQGSCKGPSDRQTTQCPHWKKHLKTSSPVSTFFHFHLLAVIIISTDMSVNS